ncbi:hypothetical protein GSI_03548 [Ganoderma sinense ZZ0214-1]|uniref:AB hydrolase-1 domain-containing protein n=1 Tax=Ganoderma sinense ZZ0214-1 TaxID=1077348 RepID=A0A2G8SJ98_9APHY|nr:hypothetical protein GSI_03548 [Ganoderma sinense ZZ0214-1]
MYGTDRKVEQASASASPRCPKTNKHRTPRRPNRRAQTLLVAVAVAVTARFPVAAGLRSANNTLYNVVCQGNLATADANSTSTASANSTSDFDWLSLKPSTDIQWTSCYDGHQCARLLLPLDYQSNGTSNATTAIALRMIPARNRTNYRGTVLMNPGGPGESGTLYMGLLGPSLSATVGDSFDFLSFDPRGVGASTPRLDCFTTSSERDIWNMQVGNQLLDASDVSLLNLYIARAQVVGARCAAASALNGDIAQFMSTASVATDMLNIVEKLGQDKLQYWGFSYGTILGQYFAAMYPDNIERMVLDGVYDGNNYRASLWNSNVINNEAVIDSLFTFCHQAGPSGCALYDSTPDAIRDRFFAVLESVKHAPVAIPLATPPLVVTYLDLIGMININAYSPIDGYPYVAATIRALETGNQTLLAALAPALATPVACDCGQAAPALPLPLNNYDTLHAVACGDADAQTYAREGYAAFFADITRVAPTVGALWAVYHLECTQWPVRPKWRYTGALAGRPAHPILIVQPKFDPAGPLHDALEVRKRYEGTGLLVQNSYGHTTPSAPSACTARYVREYFEAGTMPEEGTVCEPDVLPFVGAVNGN